MDEPWPSEKVYICSWKSMPFSSSNMAQIYQPVMMVSIWGAYSSGQSHFDIGSPPVSEPETAR